jgi:hypothetical protein
MTLISYKMLQDIVRQVSLQIVNGQNVLDVKLESLPNSNYNYSWNP